MNRRGHGCAPGTNPSPLPITVVDGDTDEVRIHSYILVNVDPFAISVRFDPPGQQGIGDIGDFNGLMVWGVNWDGESRGQNVEIDTNMAEELCNICQPYMDRIFTDESFIGFDWRRYLYTSDSYFAARFRSVPEPGTLALVGLVLVGLILTRSPYLFR